MSKINSKKIDRIAGKKPESLSDEDIDLLVEWTLKVKKELEEESRSKNKNADEACESCECDPCDCDWGN